MQGCGRSNGWLKSSSRKFDVVPPQLRAKPERTRQHEQVQLQIRQASHFQHDLLVGVAHLPKWHQTLKCRDHPMRVRGLAGVADRRARVANIPAIWACGGGRSVK